MTHRDGIPLVLSDRHQPQWVRLCIRDNGSEYSAFSPTGSETFHDVMKFAIFYDGNFIQFDHGPRDDDFLESLRVIDEFARTGKRAEGLAASIAAADRTSITGASEYAALLGIARIQTRRRQFDEAQKTLQHAEPDRLQGYWRQNFQQALDAVEKAQAEPQK